MLANHCHGTKALITPMQQAFARKDPLHKKTRCIQCRDFILPNTNEDFFKYIIIELVASELSGKTRCDNNGMQTLWIRSYTFFQIH
jgi:hypothetical protein